MAYDITPEIVNTIANLARCGSSQVYISQIINVPTSTLSRWKQDNPEVASALNVSQDGLMRDIKAKMSHTALHGTEKG